MAELPSCEGPKLHPFSSEEDEIHIEFDCQLGEGIHSYVWKVSINSQIYALKLFKFFDWEELFPEGEGIAEFETQGFNGITVDDVINHMDPFFSECRVYGRLKEVDREDLTLKCFGYLYLTPEQEQQLNGLAPHDWNRSRAHDGLPIRAIVKEYFDEDVFSSQENMSTQIYDALPSMMEDIETFHRVGIFLRDIRPPNYVGDKFIDFSISQTVPHFYMYGKYSWENDTWIQEAYYIDQDDFDHEVVPYWNRTFPREGRSFETLFFPKFPSDGEVYGKLRGGQERWERKQREIQKRTMFDSAQYDFEAPLSQRISAAAKGAKLIRSRKRVKGSGRPQVSGVKKSSIETKEKSKASRKKESKENRTHDEGGRTKVRKGRNRKK
ncbi:kinetochore Sim4 complex subunit FTA2-domain-containing protein [Xylariomycetidae sp. FL2044]|nr:kinetochore Sim4 complex subunit FTA2-domain-containing protein [Xylariomycetidae sp. FL2044]